MEPITPGSRVVVRGAVWTVVDRTDFADCAAIVLTEAGGERSGRRTVLAPFDRVVRADPPVRLRVVRPRRMMHELRRAACAAHPFGGLRTAAGVAIDILPYQLEPAMAVAAGVTRVLIADAVGLGKTIQAGLILAELAARGESFRGLVAAPAGLREQWQRELEQHLALPAIVADTAWLARTVRDLPAGVNPWALPALYIASFDFLKRPEVLRPLEDVTWDALVVDEAHNAAPGTARRAAVHAIGIRSRRVVLLTATPHGGDSEQYDALGRLGATEADDQPLLVFRRTRESVGAGPGRRSSMLAVRPSTAEQHMHRLLGDYTARICREAQARGDSRARLAAIVLRKRALSSAASLAASASRRLALLAGAAAAGSRQLALPFADEDPLDDEVPDAALAAPGLCDAGHERSLLTAIVETATRAAAGESKVGFLARLLARTREPVIVFTEYRDTLARLQAAMAEGGFPALTLHGGQPPAERAAVQHAFNTAGRLLLATDAASEGLNLQARCRIVVHYELPWTPSRLEQRTGRVDRIGQRGRVHEILLVARDTAERLVLAPLAARAARARRAVGQAPLVLDRLTESRVAAAVMDGEPLPGEPAAKKAAPASAWSDAGAAEAVRLAAHRSIGLSIHRSIGLSIHRVIGPSDVLLCGLGGSRTRVTAVYANELVTAGGRVEHAEILGVRLPVPPARVRRTAAALRDWAGAWVREVEPGVQEQLAAIRRDSLAAIAARHEEATSALERRDAAIAAAVPSASRELVQAGLFDRRALRDREIRRRGARELLEAAGMRRASRQSASHLTPRLRLLALILR